MPGSPDLRKSPWAAVPAVMLLIGFSAVIAQVVLMRELLIVFYGNEVSLGIILAGWLVWTAAGSGLLGRALARIRDPRPTVAGLELSLAVAFPCTIWAVRSSRELFHVLPGEVIGPGRMLLIAFAALIPFCVISGALFAAGSRLYGAHRGIGAGEATGTVYLLEAAGSGAGGAVASFLLLRYLEPSHIALLIALLNLLAAAVLAFRKPLAPIAVVVLAALALGASDAAGRLEYASLQRLWQGLHLTAVRNSVFGNLAVVDIGRSRTLYENGLAVFTAPDPAAAEESVQFALLEHREPRHVLIVGGGINGSIGEALRHPSIERVDYVELDPAIFDIGRAYFPVQWKQIASDRRVHLHNMDGRLYLKQPGNVFDVIILNLPEPQTAQLNRFYTVEFFREAAGRLATNGVLSFQLKASENYISPELARFLQCIYKTLWSVFPAIGAIPGENVHFFAASGPGILTLDPQEILSRLRARQIPTSYVSEYFIPFRMSPERMAGLQAQIQPHPRTPVNRDFVPIAYYFDTALWSRRFDPGARAWFDWLASVRFRNLTALIAVIMFAAAAVVRGLPRRETRRRTAAGFCAAAMGMTMIGLELLLLLGFQAIYGYVYHQLAIVIAAFMAGMALGSWRAIRSKAGLGRLAALQGMAALAPLALYLVFEALPRVDGALAGTLLAQVLFPVLAALCGYLGGYQFPIASRIFFEEPRAEHKSAGALYALDLAGSCAGAILLSAYLVPVFGFLRTALVMAAVNLAPALLAVLTASEGQALPGRTRNTFFHRRQPL